jgi:circadian clock protein KaiC
MGEQESDRDAGLEATGPALTERAATGIKGLDLILGGGLPRNHTFLLHGKFGSGKSTLAMQFCLAGAARGERVLYLTTTETEAEVGQIASSHGWSLDGVTLRYLDPREMFGEGTQQSVFHPAEIELPRTIEALIAIVQRIQPHRLVIDSLTEIRLLAEGPRWFRHQTLTLKAKLAAMQCTTLLCDDQPELERPGQSILHGVIALDQVAMHYGADRRRLRIVKMRGQSFSEGFHDLKIRTGGMEVYPRLVAAEHRSELEPEELSSGLAELDMMFGGGIDRGTSLLLLGPSGLGKSIVATQFALAAASRGERCAMYLFDERLQTLVARTESLGLGLRAQMHAGMIELQQVDPAELSPGEFAHRVVEATTVQGARFIVIDSLAGYIHAMPDERMLQLHLHELLSYLSQHGVTVLLLLTQHGLPGTTHSAPFDLSYIADSVLLFHAFEHAGELHKAISVYKRRCGPHEKTLRKLDFGPGGILIGAPLRAFQGITTGAPHFTADPSTDAVQSATC